jgi:RND family efflux transporter MFP subunit
VVLSPRAIPVRSSGVVCRRAEAQLAFKVGGIVREVLVRAGDEVAAGQVLAALDLAEIDAQLAQARSGVEKARRDRLRATELQERKVVSTELAQNAATGLEQAEAALRIAEFNRQYAIVTAPAAGRILRRLVEPNEMVPANKVAVLFASNEEGWIARAGIAERDIVRVRTGDPVGVQAAGQPLLQGTVVQIAGATDPSTHTTEVEIQLASAPAALRSGSVADLEIQPADVASRPVVPVTALVEGDGRSAHVFLLSADGHAVRRQQVTVETVDRGLAYLATELPTGARVAVSGAELLREGAAVEVAP